MYVAMALKNTCSIALEKIATAMSFWLNNMEPPAYLWSVMTIIT
jgi:hypothetical protein